MLLTDSYQSYYYERVCACFYRFFLQYAISKPSFCISSRHEPQSSSDVKSPTDLTGTGCVSCKSNQLRTTTTSPTAQTTPTAQTQSGKKDRPWDTLEEEGSQSPRAGLFMGRVSQRPGIRRSSESHLQKEENPSFPQASGFRDCVLPAHPSPPPRPTS